MDFIRDSIENNARFTSGEEDFPEKEVSPEGRHALELMENPNVKLYLNLKEKIKGKKDIEEQLRSVLEYAENYSHAVAEDVLERAKLNRKETEFSDRQLSGNADEARRRAHISLVDNFKIFCRMCNDQKIDISNTRDIILGGEEEVRNKVRKWSTDVLDYLALTK